MIRVVRRRTKREFLEQYEKREGTEKLKSERAEASCAVLSHIRLFATVCSRTGFSARGILQARILELGCHALLQGIFPTQRSIPHLLQLLHCRGIFTTEPPGETPKQIIVMTRVSINGNYIKMVSASC